MISIYDQDTDLDNPRYYALKQACKFGVLSTVRSILHSEDSAGQDRHQSEPFTQRQLLKCLFEAFANRYFDVVRHLIREAGVEIDPIERDLASYASTHRMPVETFEFLLQEGWDINRPLYEFRTALSNVLHSFSLTKWFLENGANPNLGPDTFRLRSREASMISNSGFVFDYATSTSPAITISLIDLLLHHGARPENSIPLHILAECGPYQFCEQHKLPLSISHPEVYDDLKTNPPCVISSSRMPVLKYLINLGYDPNASDIAHSGPHAHGPPLHWAVRGGQVENARFLLENGADPWGQNPKGLNALEAAKVGYDPTGEGEMLKLIKEYMKR